MEQDNDDWLDKKGFQVDQLLDIVVTKWLAIAKGLRGKSKEKVDHQYIIDVLDQTRNLAGTIGTWHEGVYPLKVPLLPADKSLFNEMVVLRGRSPWSFALTYKHVRREIFKKVNPLALIPFTASPKKGVYLCCVYHQQFFRALSLDVVSCNRLKVFDIDSCETLIVPLKTAYLMPKEESIFHALSLNCTMMNNEPLIEEMWTEDMEAIFTHALKNCALRVEIVETLDECPPRHLVNLTGTSSDGSQIDFSHWLHNVLIPDMKQLQPLKAGNKLIYLLKENSLDPLLPKTVCSLDEILMKEKLRSIVNSPSLSKDDTWDATVSSDQHERLDVEIPAQSLYPVDSYFKDNVLTTICSREHIVDDTKVERLPVNSGAVIMFNVLKKINLPPFGNVQNLTITHITDSLSFYVRLDSESKEIVENGFVDTLELMLERINTDEGLANRPLLSGPPFIGEFVLFFDQWVNAWSRGILTELRLTNLNVFNPDVGSIEKVPLSALRSPHPSDAALPSQAILMVFHNLKVIEGKEAEAKEYFRQLVWSRKCHVVMKNINSVNFAIEVELFTSDDKMSVNDTLFLSGLFYQSTPSV